MDMFEDLFDEFGRSSSEFVPPSFKSPKIVPRVKEGKRSQSVKKSTKAGKKGFQKDRAKVAEKSDKKAPKTDQGSVETPNAESDTATNAENDANSSTAEAAPKGKKRRLRLMRRVD